MPAQKNKTILLIAYYFPPLGMGGVGRSYALFRYLPDYGYNVIVLTVKDILYPHYDYTLLNENDKTMIQRCGSLDPARLLYLAGINKQSHSSFPNLSKRLPFYFPDLKRGWIYFAYKKLKKLIEVHDISAVITTSPPPSVHLLGLKLKKISNIPWVADFRDYWFPLPIEKIYPDGIMKNYSLKLKAKIMKKADKVVSVNNDLKSYFGRGEVIMNGADQTVVEKWQKPYDKEKDRLIIGALGTFNYLCPIEPLFESVRVLIDNNKLARNRIQIVHAGHCDADILQLIKKYSLNDSVVLKGYLDRAKAIEALLHCDLLYLGVNQFGHYNILPGRVFDYLVSGKPIVGVVPPGSDVAALLDEYPYGTAITDYDTNKIADSIFDIYNKKREDSISVKFNKDESKKFTMPALANKYAIVLDRLLVGRPDPLS